MESDEVFTVDQSDIIINEADGLPNVHPNLSELDVQNSNDTKTNGEGAQTLDDLIHDNDLPTSLIVTNIDKTVFQNDEAKVRVIKR